MRWKEFQIDSVGFVEVGVEVVVRVTVVFNENGFDVERWLIFPPVVDESDDADALDPHPELSAGLWLVLSGDVKCNCGNVDVSFQSLKKVRWDVLVCILGCGVGVVEDLVD